MPAAPRADAAIVIPNWNGGARLVRVLTDLGRQTLVPARVIVIDNASTDESAGAAEDAGAEVVRWDSNRGFAPAVNEGIRRAAPQSLVGIVNNDVELAPEWLEQLAAGLARHPQAAFATGKIYSAHERNSLDAAFDFVPAGLCPCRAGYGCADGPDWSRERYIASAPMTAALFRRDLFETIGPLDERFESYLEDADFGLRCALAGQTGVYLPAARAWHWGSATLGVWRSETVRLLSRNQVLLARKYRPRSWISKRGWAVLVAQLLWGALAIRHHEFSAWWTGKREGLRTGPPPEGGVPDRDRLESVLAHQQEELRRLRGAWSADTFWRAYFLLT